MAKKEAKKVEKKSAPKEVSAEEQRDKDRKAREANSKAGYVDVKEDATVQERYKEEAKEMEKAKPVAGKSYGVY